jgi:hypothetical protein
MPAANASTCSAMAHAPAAVADVKDYCPNTTQLQDCFDPVVPCKSCGARMLASDRACRIIDLREREREKEKEKAR